MTTTIPTRNQQRNQYLVALGFTAHRCICPEASRLYSRVEGQGYSYRTQYVNGDGEPITACPGCGHPLTPRWLQTIGERREASAAPVLQTGDEVTISRAPYRVIGTYSGSVTFAAVLPSGQLARPGRDSQVSYSRAELAAGLRFGSIV